MESFQPTGVDRGTALFEAEHAEHPGAIWCWLLSCLLLLLAAPAHGCRCAERNLADYFMAADHVAVGRLLNSQQVDLPVGVAGLELEIELLAALHKPVAAAGPQAGDRRRYRTSTSSASCGIKAEADAIYLLFAQTDDTDGTLAVDSCSGTRVLLPADGSAPAGFRDVPPRFVMQQLNGLAGLDVLRVIAREHPDEESADNDVLVGLLDIASLSHTGFGRLFAEPEREAAIVAEFSTYEQLQSQEVSYETPAALVYSRHNGWYRLRLDDGHFGWLPPDFAGTYFAYDRLPVRRLAYLRAPWHGFVWPSPGAGLPARALPGTAAKQPIEVFESQRIGGSLWFRISILNASRCDGGTPSALLSGWVPAYGLSGQPLVWFYSRGC